MVPRHLGVVPRHLGVVPRHLGVVPRHLGMVPRQLIVVPRHLGMVPRQYFVALRLCSVIQEWGILGCKGARELEMRVSRPAVWQQKIGLYLEI